MARIQSWDDYNKEMAAWALKNAKGPGTPALKHTYWYGGDSTNGKEGKDPLEAWRKAMRDVYSRLGVKNY